MPFKKPTLNEIATRIKGDIVAKTRTGNPLERSFIQAISYSLAGAFYLLYSFLGFTFKQVFPDTAEKENLERWSTIWGITRKPGSFAERDVQVTGLVGATIEAGSIVQDDNNNQYAVESEVTLAATSGVVHVVAESPGTEFNLAVGAKVSFESAISGVESEATVLATNKLDSEDPESDDLLLERLLERIQAPPAGGRATDYSLWAKEISGVTRAWVYPGRLGVGTVGVSFVTDNAESLIPTATKVQEVQDYIDTKKTVTVDATVFAPVESTVDMTIRINPNTTVVQEAITAEVEDLFNRASEPEGRIYISQVREAISTALGEADHILVTPTEDIVAGSGEIKTLGIITFQTMVYS